MPRPLCYPVRTAGGEYALMGELRSWTRVDREWAGSNAHAEMAMQHALRCATLGDLLLVEARATLADRHARTAHRSLPFRLRWRGAHEDTIGR